MRAARLATVAALLFISFSHAPPAKAQVLFTTGTGVCHLCGHSELDTERYVHSFLNQLFFPRSVARRTSIAASLYLLTATYTMNGRLSPDPRYSSVTIAITAEVKNLLPTGNYHLTVTTPGGKTSKDTYAIGAERFSVTKPYLPGAKRKSSGGAVGSGGTGSTGSGGRPRSGPAGGGVNTSGGNRRPAGCSRSRMEARGNETIVYCSRD